MTALDATIIAEIEDQRPRFSVGLLSREEKDRLIERALVGLYRWYLARSQKTRNWNPNDSFNWRELRTDHSPLLNHIIEGFYAVEQFVPDYTMKTIDMMRRSYGRSHFQIRWGAEEEKHADLWLNAMLFLKHRTPDWVRDYAEALHHKDWLMPWDDPLHIACYVVIQERATQLNYLNTAIIAKGKSDHPEMINDADPVLLKVTQTIAIDEAAHYNFFLEVARLYLYYYPAQTLQALQDVIKHFTMPALDLITVMPDQANFEEATYRGAVYTPRQHTKDVLSIALKHMGGFANRKALALGIKRSRLVPDEDGNLRDTSIFEYFDYHSIQNAVKRLFGRIIEYEKQIGIGDIDPTQFVPSGLMPVRSEV